MYRSGTYWVTKPRSEATLYIEGEILVEDGGGRHPTSTGQLFGRYGIVVDNVE